MLKTPHTTGASLEAKSSAGAFYYEIQLQTKLKLHFYTPPHFGTLSAFSLSWVRGSELRVPSWGMGSTARPPTTKGNCSCSLAKNYSMSVYILKLKFSTCEAESNNGRERFQGSQGSQGQLHRWQMSTRSGPHLTVKWRTFKQSSPFTRLPAPPSASWKSQVLNTNSPN